MPFNEKSLFPLFIYMLPNLLSKVSLGCLSFQVPFFFTCQSLSLPYWTSANLLKYFQQTCPKSPPFPFTYFSYFSPCFQMPGRTPPRGRIWARKYSSLYNTCGQRRTTHFRAWWYSAWCLWGWSVPSMSLCPSTTSISVRRVGDLQAGIVLPLGQGWSSSNCT